jgi:hypothetical protein
MVKSFCWWLRRRESHPVADSVAQPFDVMCRRRHRNARRVGAASHRRDISGLGTRKLWNRDPETGCRSNPRGAYGASMKEIGRPSRFPMRSGSSSNHGTASIHRICRIFSGNLYLAQRRQRAGEIFWSVLERATQAVQAGKSLYAWSRAEMARKESCRQPGIRRPQPQDELSQRVARMRAG